MKFNENLSAIHGYLCGDGYVIKNPESQSQKYYHIGFRNTNDVLLRDFQKKFQDFFGFKPYITKDGRCRIQNKDIYNRLTKNYSYYSYEWELPRLSKQNLKFWLRAFFDCEGWVENQPAKSRLIGLDCCNELGVLSIQESLEKLGIKSQVKKKLNRTIWRITICGLDNLKRFHEEVNFLHPEKKRKLSEAIGSYQNYSWKIPTNKSDVLKFIKRKGRIRESRGEIRFMSIKKENLINLAKALNTYQMPSKLFGPWHNKAGSKYHCLTIKNKNVHGKTRTGSSTRNEANI